MRRRTALLAAAGAISCMLCTASPAAAAPLPAGFVPFAPDSIWNLPLRDDAPLHPDSAAYMGFLNQQVSTHGAYANSSQCGTPIFLAEEDTPRIAVRLDHPSYQDPALARAWQSVPMPPDARPANCTDRNMAIVQRQPDGTWDQWEFFKAVKNEDGSWVANWGGRTEDMQRDRGVASTIAWLDPTGPYGARNSKASWNVTATSISTMGGTITLDELARRRIDHAVAVALSSAAKSRFLFPAQRTDGGNTAPFAVPEGAHLRLDPNLDLSKIAMVPLVRMIAEAAQKYGIVVRDTTGNATTFVAQEAPPGSGNVLAPHLGGQFTGNALKAFPWAHLQMLDAAMCTGYNGCAPTQRAQVDADRLDNGDIVLDTSNSVLSFPRKEVSWDLDGDGTFERGAGADVKLTVPAGALSKGATVRIVTQAGSVVVGGHPPIVEPPGETPQPTQHGQPASEEPQPTPAAPGPPPAAPAPTAAAPTALVGPTRAPALPAPSTPAVDVVRNEVKVIRSGKRTSLTAVLRCNRTTTCRGVATVVTSRRSGTAQATVAKIRYRLSPRTTRRVSKTLRDSMAKHLRRGSSRRLQTRSRSSASGKRLTISILGS